MTWRSRVKIGYYSVRATKVESVKWGYWSRVFGLRSVGQWLERLARLEVRRLEAACGVCDPPKPSPLRPPIS